MKKDSPIDPHDVKQQLDPPPALNTNIPIPSPNPSTAWGNWPPSFLANHSEVTPNMKPKGLEELERKTKDMRHKMREQQDKLVKDLRTKNSQKNVTVEVLKKMKKKELARFEPPTSPPVNDLNELDLAEKTKEVQVTQITGLLMGTGLSEEEAKSFAHEVVALVGSQDSETIRKMLEKKVQTAMAKRMLDQYADTQNLPAAPNPPKAMTPQPIERAFLDPFPRESSVVLELEGEYLLLKKKPRTLVDNGRMHEFYVLEDTYKSVDDLLRRNKPEDQSKT